MTRTKRIFFLVCTTILFGWVTCNEITDYLIFDREYSQQMSDFEAATTYLKNKKELESLILECDLQLNSHGFESWEDDGVLITINSDDCDCVVDYNASAYKLLKNSHILKIIVMKNGNIVYHLKSCERLYDCDPHIGGYHGRYAHFISKDQIEFHESKWTNVQARKTMYGWNYYVVWYSKG